MIMADETTELAEPLAEPAAIDKGGPPSVDAGDGTADDAQVGEKELGELLDLVDAEEPGQVTAKPIVPAVPAVVPAPPPTAAVVPAVPAASAVPAPVPAPATAPAPVIPTPAPAPAPPAPTPEQLATHRKTVRESARQAIEQQYSLSEDDAGLLVTEPGKVLPKLAANLYMDIFDAVLGNVMVQLPALVQGINHSTQLERTLEQRFFEKWPALSKPEYAEAVARLGMVYRRSNPDVTVERAIQDIGAMAHVSLSVPYEQVAAGATAPAPNAPTTLVPAVQRPFVPAVGGVTPAAAFAAPTDSWTALVESFEKLD